MALNVEEAKKIASEYEQTIKNAEALNSLREKQLALLQAELDLDEKIKKISEQQTEIVKKRADLRQAERDSDKEYLILQEAIKKADQTQIDAAKTAYDQAEKNKEQAKQALKVEEEKVKTFEKQIKTIEQVGNALKKSFESGEQAAKKMFNVSQSFFDQFKGQAADEINEFFKGFTVQALQLESVLGMFDKGLKKLGTAILDGFNIPLLGTKIKGLREIVTEVLQGPSEAFKKFGFLDQYEGSIKGMRQAMLGIGVSEKELRDAVGELSQGFGAFSELNKDMRDGLIDTAAKLGLAGVNGKTYANSLTIMTKVLGQTVPQANATTKSITALSLSLQQGTKGLDDFISLAPKLAGISKPEEVFTKTAIAAKKLGMETKELFGILDQYDTFDKAAEAAGELNLALGGQFINSVDLMNASLKGDTMGVLKMLQDGFEKSGVQIENVNRSTLKYYASAIKIPEDTLYKMFGKGSKGMEQYMKDQEETAKRQQELNDIADHTQSVFQKIQNAFAAAFGTKENINSLIKVVDNIGKISFFLARMLKTITSLVPIMGALFAASSVMSFTMAVRAAYVAMDTLKMKTIGAAIADAVKLAFGGPVGLGLLAAGGVAALTAGALVYNALGSAGEGAGNEGANVTGQITSGISGNSIKVQSPSGPSEKVDDFVVGGGSSINAGGKSYITSASDTVVAAKEGGVLATKLDMLIQRMDNLAARPVQVMMNGRKVSEEITLSNKYNPFIGNS